MTRVIEKIYKFWSERFKFSAVILLHTLILMPVFLALSASFIFTADDFEHSRGILFLVTKKCQFKEITGFPCPTCGLSRGFCEISHGRFKNALTYNLFVYFWYSAFVITAAVFSFSLICYLLGTYITKLALQGGKNITGTSH